MFVDPCLTIICQMAEEKKKKIRFEKQVALANDVETLVDDVFGTLRGKKADEIVDSLKSSGLRRKKGSSRRIGAGGLTPTRKANPRFDHEYSEEQGEDGDHEEDDALTAMMNQLGVDQSAMNK
jgi:hypothetical protein